MSASSRFPSWVSLADRIRIRSEVDDNGCWIWQGSLHHSGYGLMSFEKRRWWVHRASYTAFTGPIPGGMTVDHLCFVPACVNPTHLQLLSNEDNAARQRIALATHCARGHEFTPDNTLTHHRRTPGAGQRACRECFRKAARERERRVRAENAARKRGEDVGPSPKEIRAWARTAGLDCSPFGRVPGAVREAYETAMRGAA